MDIKELFMEEHEKMVEELLAQTNLGYSDLTKEQQIKFDDEAMGRATDRYSQWCDKVYEENR